MLSLVRGVSLVLLPLAGLGLGYYASPRAAASPAKAASQSEAPATCAANEAKIASLAAEVARLEALLNGVSNQKDGAKAHADAREQQQVVEAPTPQQEAAWLSARSAFYDRYLKQQPRDERFADELERKAVAAAKEQKQAGVELTDARCYTNHCRFEYTYRDAEARGQHLTTVGPAFVELPRVSYAYPGAPEVQNRAVLYLSKAEQPLPAFDYASFVAQSSR